MNVAEAMRHAESEIESAVHHLQNARSLLMLSAIRQDDLDVAEVKARSALLSIRLNEQEEQQ